MDVAATAANIAIQPLSADRLYRPTDISQLQFVTTADLPLLDRPVGQARALEAIRFGTEVDKVCFNLLVIGPSGSHMQGAGLFWTAGGCSVRH